MSFSTLFLPDISGFTKFVKNTEIIHSQHIIQELINTIINAGKKSFEIAEVEGDAVFFFKSEKKFSIAEIEEETKYIYQQFHKQLLLYEHKRICNCGACSTAINLKLKFIVHAGEISFVKFSKDKLKPYGSPVIEAHRLLKNPVPINEYLLLSKQFIAEETFLDSNDGSISDEDLGSIEFSYLDISDWKADVKFEEPKTEKVDFEVESSLVVPHKINILHQYISDFKYRKYWNKGADEIIYDENEVNQEGSEHYCVINGKNLYFDTIKPKIESNGLSYGEILKNPRPLKYFESNFLILPEDEHNSHLSVQLKASVKWQIQKLILPILKNMLLRQAKSVLKEISKSLNEHINEVEADVS